MLLGKYPLFAVRIIRDTSIHRVVKVKVKFSLERAMKAQRGVEV
jgi:hypothetical protein